MPNNLVVSLLLIVLWIPLFWKRPKIEWLIFIIVNIIFVFNDVAAIQNHFFQFTKPDIFNLPYWEFLMWGFYLQHAHRFLNLSYPNRFEWKGFLLAIVFSALFGLISDRSLLLVLSTSWLFLSFVFYHQKEDFLFCGYLMLLGTIFEFVGIRQNLWSYPNQEYHTAWIQFVVMWGFVGLFFRRLVGPFLSSQKIS